MDRKFTCCVCEDEVALHEHDVYKVDGEGFRVCFTCKDSAVKVFIRKHAVKDPARRN